jgi:hypothetical protein
MKSLMAAHIKAVILANPAPESSQVPKAKIGSGKKHLFCLASQHINSAARLTKGDPVCRILATAAVEGSCRLRQPPPSTFTWHEHCDCTQFIG